MIIQLVNTKGSRYCGCLSQLSANYKNVYILLHLSILLIDSKHVHFPKQIYQPQFLVYKNFADSGAHCSCAFFFCVSLVSCGVHLEWKYTLICSMVFVFDCLCIVFLIALGPVKCSSSISVLSFDFHHSFSSWTILAPSDRILIIHTTDFIHPPIFQRLYSF
jgi:hypothetical protein